MKTLGAKSVLKHFSEAWVPACSTPSWQANGTYTKSTLFLTYPWLPANISCPEASSFGCSVLSPFVQVIIDQSEDT